MVRSTLATAASLVLTTTVVTHAYYLKRQFYPTVVYLTKSSPSMAVLYIQAFVLVFLIGKFMRKVFFGQLRAAEMEHLIERSWYAVTETCLAFTVFRDDFSPRFVALFTLLLFLKCFHWLAEDRVDFMERSPNISWLFHFRVVSLMGLLALLDLLFVNHACHSIMTRGASVQLVFGFEYAILLTMVLTIFIKYILHTIDLQSENPWDNKAVYMLYTELLTGFIKVLLYMAFMTIMIKVHTFPLFAIRPMYLTMRQFKKAVTDAIMSRRAIRNMNTLYPDASLEELQQTDNVCIICREEMVTGAKRLPCNHIFHTSCLRSWFQRQQTCPTCRMDVLRVTLPTQTPPPQPPQPQVPQTPLVPQQPNLPPGMPPFPPGMFPFWPPMGQHLFPQAPGAAPNVPQSNTSAPAGAEGQASAGEESRSTETMSGTGLETPGAGSIPGFPFSFPPFPSAPWVGMPPPPFGMPPMPMPPSGFAGLTDEELRAMEGQERQNLEARLQCLQNIHTLLDAAMVQIHQYLSVVATLSPPRPTATTSSAPSTESTDPTSGSQVDSTGDSPPPAFDSTSAQSPLQPEEIGQIDLEGAVGYSVPDSAEVPDDEKDALSEPDAAELRRRRLRKLDLPSGRH
ncbi:E3 ubiquitin-protein ligase synoviolin [Chiloscyllium plagiosum]|uniref:E3 ubiquitin-protein ligase synoviolin n=1 Tax=Chiloscyllium plagiosum TaxID=36176 RepID=UPI001CB7F608|nr:E3 ubiquitin-protein ligase synoviolin [Chiloscyllium plagiosum]XP_043538540.1 E3 ubiquitin-protein ligase synoviolin [Chiloscyllium plagiosum]XP_043538541.1 E3 ubiquitin-protein ligase synoviolin [Chiloscyllium plagiosum]XP_043538542.1 E3 ubiquitin-protein ligase synoviolin [Chiloscyllium plagiosum]XP_043538543.1 E3 ubiquitin-protein ligase synoviolin [Chiloscyllium plagiosum]